MTATIHERIATNEPTKSRLSPSQMADRFARDLGKLSRKYGIAVTDQPSLFVMQTEEYDLEYIVNDEGKLIRA